MKRKAVNYNLVQLEAPLEPQTTPTEQLSSSPSIPLPPQRQVSRQTKQPESVQQPEQSSLDLLQDLNMEIQSYKAGTRDLIKDIKLLADLIMESCGSNLKDSVEESNVTRLLNLPLESGSSVSISKSDDSNNKSKLTNSLPVDSDDIKPIVNAATEQPVVNNTINEVEHDSLSSVVEPVLSNNKLVDHISISSPVIESVTISKSNIETNISKIDSKIQLIIPKSDDNINKKMDKTTPLAQEPVNVKLEPNHPKPQDIPIQKEPIDSENRRVPLTKRVPSPSRQISLGDISNNSIVHQAEFESDLLSIFDSFGI